MEKGNKNGTNQPRPPLTPPGTQRGHPTAAIVWLENCWLEAPVPVILGKGYYTHGG